MKFVGMLSKNLTVLHCSLIAWSYRPNETDIAVPGRWNRYIWTSEQDELSSKDNLLHRSICKNVKHTLYNIRLFLIFFSMSSEFKRTTSSITSHYSFLVYVGILFASLLSLTANISNARNIETKNESSQNSLKTS